MIFPEKYKIIHIKKNSANYKKQRKRATWNVAKSRKLPEVDSRKGTIMHIHILAIEYLLKD